MKFVGIDIGSTASKVVVLNEEKTEILHRLVMPSGWNSRETGEVILHTLEEWGVGERKIVATGYGRISVPYADKSLTEITCHARGASFLMPGNFTLLDIGGQDTKVIVVENNMVTDFLMNDKCSAGTGKFLEIMANRLGDTLPGMFDLAEQGEAINISSMCTVFAESEIISLMGEGTPKEDIARGVIESIVQKVSSLARRKQAAERYFLTGGFAESPRILDYLSHALDAPVESHPDGRYAGALGAALLARA